MTLKNIGIAVASAIGAAAVVFTGVKVFLLTRDSGTTHEDSGEKFEGMSGITPYVNEKVTIVHTRKEAPGGSIGEHPSNIVDSYDNDKREISS